MSIPSYVQMISPLLQFLGKQTSSVPTTIIHEGVARLVGLTEEEKNQFLPSKTQQVYKNRIGWAHDALKRAKLSSSPKRGEWQLTEEGKQLHAKFTTGLPLEECKIISLTDREVPLAQISGTTPVSIEVPDSVSQISPEEKIEEGLREIKESVALGLLELIGNQDFRFFERLVLNVLHALGYGSSESSLQHVGRSGDEGIDGIISLDKLGFEKIYVQAKRWKGTVNSSEIQTFIGALHLKKATKGVLITTGSITAPAYEIAKQANGSIVLIDGIMLANLMIESGVGVSHRSIKIPSIDHDYFE